MRFKKGDMVKIMNKSIGLCAKCGDIGEIGTIKCIEGDGSGDDTNNCIIVDIEDSMSRFFSPRDLKLISSETPKELDGFKKVMEELVSLKESKAGDYKNSWKVLGIEGLNYQLARKFTRIWINRNKEKLNNEVLRDSYVDLAVYAIMCIQLLDSGEKEDKILEMLKG